VAVRATQDMLGPPARPVPACHQPSGLARPPRSCVTPLLVTRVTRAVPVPAAPTSRK
jgi:hypothetical protein